MLCPSGCSSITSCMLCKHDGSSGRVVCIAQSHNLINACACVCAHVYSQYIPLNGIGNSFAMNIYCTVCLTIHGNNEILVYRPALATTGPWTVSIGWFCFYTMCLHIHLPVFAVHCSVVNHACEHVNILGNTRNISGSTQISETRVQQTRVKMLDTCIHTYTGCCHDQCRAHSGLPQ